MKALLRLLFLTLIAGAVFTSCKKEDPEPEDPTVNTTDTVTDPTNPTNPTTPSGLTFSSYTTEQNKANLEQAGIDLMNNLDALPDGTAMLAFQQLGDLSTSTSQTATVARTGILQLTESARVNPTALKSTMEDITLQAEIDEIEAEYSWNSVTMEWDSTAANDRVVFNFPYDNTSTTNDCQLSIDFTITSVNFFLTGLAEAPSNIIMALVVRGTEVSSLSLSATYDSDGLPATIIETLTIDTYMWQLSMSQSATEVSSDWLFKNGSTTLMNYGFAVGGDFNADRIEDYANRLDTLNDYQQGIVAEAGTYLANVEFYFQVMDIKLVQTANTTNLAQSADDILAQYGTGELSETTEIEMENDMLDALNADFDMYIMYVSDNSIFAEMELYMVETQDTYTNYVWNETTMTYEEVEVTDTYREPMPQFVFGENESPVDADVYFQEGFDSFQTEFDEMVSNIESMTDAWN